MHTNDSAASFAASVSSQGKPPPTQATLAKMAAEPTGVNIAQLVAEIDKVSPSTVDQRMAAHTVNCLKDLSDKKLVAQSRAAAVDLMHWDDPRGLLLARAYVSKYGATWLVSLPAYNKLDFQPTKAKAVAQLARAIRELLDIQ